MQRPRSKAEVYLHLVWATKDRRPLLMPERERAIHRCIEQEARKCGCDVLAVGGMPDHVHLALKLPTTIAVAALMKQIKGISSAFANDLSEHKSLFRWQEGYGVLSVSRPHTPRVIGYIENQKRHHAAGKIWPELEETCEEFESSDNVE